MSVPIVLCSLQIIQRNHIKNCVIINPESLYTVFKVQPPILVNREMCEK
jgi:hypothetical protein